MLGNQLHLSATVDGAITNFILLAGTRTKRRKDHRLTTDVFSTSN